MATEYAPTDDAIVAVRREFRASLAAIVDGRDPARVLSVSAYLARLADFGLDSIIIAERLRTFSGDGNHA